MPTTTPRPFRPHGHPVWRTLIKADDELNFMAVAREADIDYPRVMRMSRGEAPTSPEVWKALANLTGHSVSDLQEAVDIRMSLVTAEDGDAS